MNQVNPNPSPSYFSDSPTITIVGMSNMGADLYSVQSVTSCSIPMDCTMRSVPLSEATVRIGNSLLSARIPEARIRRDYPEEF
jgi:hypothetical protein